MIDPNTVHSPRDRWTLVEVLHQGPPDEEEKWWALALGYWVDGNGPGKPCLAARWNGASDPGSKGNPISRGYPTWFILPTEIADKLIDLVPAEKRDRVLAILGEEEHRHF